MLPTCPKPPAHTPKFPLQDSLPCEWRQPSVQAAPRKVECFPSSLFKMYSFGDYNDRHSIALMTSHFRVILVLDNWSCIYAKPPPFVSLRVLCPFIQRKINPAPKAREAVTKPWSIWRTFSDWVERTDFSCQLFLPEKGNKTKTANVHIWRRATFFPCLFSDLPLRHLPMGGSQHEVIV